MTSILRRAQLEYIRDIKLKGSVIDLGAKNSENIYFSLFNRSAVDDFTFADYYHTGPNLIKIDFEKRFEVPDESYDSIVAFNVLEHIYNYNQFISECYRISRPNAELHMVIPFLWKFHEDPYDFHRYTHQAIEKMLTDNGWDILIIEPTIDGQFSVLCSLFESYVPKFTRTLFQNICMGLDKIVSRKRNRKTVYPLGYNVLAKKLTHKN